MPCANATKERNQGVSWVTTELVLGMYGGSRKKFEKAQALSFQEGGSFLEDLRYGLYLGSEGYSEECIERLKGEGSDEKPQGRSLMRSRDLRKLAIKIQEGLGEKEPESKLRVRKYRCRNRDVAIYILYQLGVYLNEEVGEVFGVGYTAVTGAAKRGQEYVKSEGRVERTVKKIIADI
jgi:hypothetical protein